MAKWIKKGKKVEKDGSSYKDEPVFADDDDSVETVSSIDRANKAEKVIGLQHNSKAARRYGRVTVKKG